MDEIAPLRASSLAVHHGPGGLPGRHATPALPASPAHNPAAVKGPADYLRALRRRVWLVLAVALPLAIAASTWTLRQPRIYQAVAEVTIDPPQYDPILSTLVSRDIGRHDAHAQESYIPNLIALLKSRSLAAMVVGSPALTSEASRYDDPEHELILKGLVVRPVLKTNMILVSLEGKDPARTKKVLETLLETFKNVAQRNNDLKVDDTKVYAEQRKSALRQDFEKLDHEIIEHLKKERTIGPGGRNILEDQYVSLGATLAHKQARIGELSQQLMISRSFPKPEFGPGQTPREQRIAQLLLQKKKLQLMLRHDRHTMRNFNADPAAKEHAVMLNEVLDELDDLNRIKTEMPKDPTAMILDRFQAQLEDDQAQQQAVLAQLQDSMPKHQKFLSLVEERNAARHALIEMDRNLQGFEILSQSQKDLVKTPTSVAEPTVPIRPSRVMYIGLGVLASLALGVGLVCLMEHVDHAVRVPEHVTQGLILPLLGVVPRIRRTALTHRGGHLWTAGTPDSIEADAFRNVRASLLGLADRRGPIVTLLMTSPKAGDGKSTAALNLAATCARAGERTLLLDVDLRRPTLADVFPPEAGKDGPEHGLVDVLQGILPWQKTLRHTELRNLDFIPTGDPSDVPIEILGTLELRQLLLALSKHYDRVILDGPAVLGMADCRMLGRMVDAVVLVVRSGAHQLTTLQRAKGMLEQSHVPIAGVVVNALNEDIHNWSSYGYDGAQAGLSGSGSGAYRRVRAPSAGRQAEGSPALAGAMDR